MCAAEASSFVFLLMKNENLVWNSQLTVENLSDFPSCWRMSLLCMY